MIEDRPTARDAFVRPLWEEEIAEEAQRLRRLASMQDDEKLDVLALLRWLQSGSRISKGRLEIDITEMPLATPALITFNPLRLQVDPEIWDLAEIGDPQSVYILAHEIGHAVLHDANARSFSVDGSKRTLFGMRERSAEWQADRFADHLCVPDHILLHYLTTEDLVIGCNVSTELAERRVSRRSVAKKLLRAHVGEACPDCQNFTLVRNGTCLKCDTCGTTTGCS